MKVLLVAAIVMPLAVFIFLFGDMYRSTGFLCLRPVEIARLEETIPVMACGKGVYVEFQDVEDLPSRFTTFEDYALNCKYGCSFWLNDILLKDHPKLTKDQRNYMQMIARNIGRAKSLEDLDRASQVDVSHTLQPKKTVVFDPKNGLVDGFSLCKTVEELQKSFGNDRVQVTALPNEIDGPEQMIAIDFGSGRSANIHVDRKMVSLTHPDFVTVDGLHAGLTWQDFEKKASCDASTWEGGEISRAQCNDMMVGMSAGPAPQRMVDTIYFICDE